jgi:AraC-like DNA-binding protein
MIKKYLFIFSFCLVGKVFSQESTPKSRDTLRSKNYDYLFEEIEDLENNGSKQLLYLRYFLFKAKSEKNLEEIINGYKNYVHRSPTFLKLVYADSMIFVAKKSGRNDLIGSSYLSKGIEFYAQKKQNDALDNYLVADAYISKTNDQYLIHKVKYNIAQIKYYLGYYNEAISLFTECIGFFKENNVRGYLNSLHSLGLCYNHIGNYGLCTETNKKGILEGEKFANYEMAGYFNHSEGINQYFKNNYATAIEQITHSLPAIKSKKDFANEAVGYFYIGRSYWNLKKPEVAISYFKKVDVIFDNKGYIRPDLLENYRLLILYYKSKDNLKIQLHYINRLLKADSIVLNKFKYLSSRITKEYDPKNVLLEKQKIEKLLDNRKRNDTIFTGIIALLFLSVALISYQYLRIKRRYRQKFEALMIKVYGERKTHNTGIDDIHQDTVTTLIKQLQKFEKDKKFLDKDLTAAKLTASVGSNAKYLSKVIYHFRGKKFTDYINDLKVDHLIQLLKEDKKLRNYTNKALGEEIGFSSTQRFTNAFFTRTGIPPSYFIEELKKGHS